MKLKIERYWAMPNHKTFTIAPLKKLINEELGRVIQTPFLIPLNRMPLNILKQFRPIQSSIVFLIRPILPISLKQNMKTQVYL